MPGFEVMFQTQKGEVSAARRTVYFALHKTYSPYTLYNTALTDKKAKLSLNGGAAADSTNNLEEVDTTNLPGLYSLELTAAEVSALGTLAVSGKIAGISCEGGCLVQIVSFDPYNEGSMSDLALHFNAA